jgi:hypothetical protein
MNDYQLINNMKVSYVLKIYERTEFYGLTLNDDSFVPCSPCWYT